MSNAPQPSDQLIKRIAKDIEQSGFPLEMHVLNVCSTKNTGRMPSVRYDYLDELREIDLLAFFETIANSHHTSTDLIIECKKATAKPWVFFSTPSYRFDNVASFLKYESDFDLYFKKHDMVSLLARIHPRILGHYADPNVPRCITYCEAFRNDSRRSEIYDAIDSVITFLCYRRESRLKRLEDFGVFTEFYVPIIVVDGRLFEATVKPSEVSEVEVRERSHLQLRTFHRQDVYIIDVVTRDHFQQFFEELAKVHEQLALAIGSLRMPKLFRETANARRKQKRQSFRMLSELTILGVKTRRARKAK
jgi:hypothetical protein